jgi:hypothetical protein
VLLGIEHARQYGVGLPLLAEGDLGPQDRSGQLRRKPDVVVVQHQQAAVTRFFQGVVFELGTHH